MVFAACWNSAIAITMTYLMLFIVPKFPIIFTEMLGNEPLPMLTNLIIGLANFQLLYVLGLPTLLILNLVICLALGLKDRTWMLSCWVMTGTMAGGFALFLIALGLYLPLIRLMAWLGDGY